MTLTRRRMKGDPNLGTNEKNKRKEGGVNTILTPNRHSSGNALFQFGEKSGETFQKRMQGWFGRQQHPLNLG